MPRALALAALVAALAACETDLPEEHAGRTEDVDAFATRAQPVLARDCAFPTCHGALHAGLRLYAVGRSRQVPEPSLDELLFEPLTNEELAANLAAVLPFVDPGAPEQSELVERALPRDDGGRGHGGGVLFGSRADPDCEALVGWIADEVEEAAP